MVLRLLTYWALLIGAVLASGCGKTRAQPAPPVQASAALATPQQKPLPPEPGDPNRGQKLAVEFECHRCHEGTGLAELPRERHCVHCHEDIEAGKLQAPAAKLAEWKQGVRGVAHVPSLVGLARFDSEWLTQYLLSPRDLRPNLVSTMPRLALEPSQARDIAAYLQSRKLVPQPGDAPSRADAKLGDDTEPPGDVQAGRVVAETRGCAGCHAFGRLSGWPSARGTGTAVELAPDLSVARERLDRSSIVKWVMEPSAIKPDTLMPSLGLSAQDARDLAAFLLGAALEPSADASVPKRLPLLERPVTFAEVDQRVFSETCRHCHSNTEAAFGDGGPGYDGGFGFKPRRVDLSSHRGASSGLLAEDGQRRSLFQRLPDGTPRLLAALLARQAEESGHPVPRVRGMPLGLPSLSPEQIQLVESWIAQGHTL